VVTAASPRVLGAPRWSLLEYWHLLGLDAPTVAALWCYTFLRAEHFGAVRMSPLLLALATWVVYVADRILDGVRPQTALRLRARHVFHARHRPAFICAAIAIAGIAGPMAAAILTREELREDLVLLGVSLGYFAVIHSGTSWVDRWFPKETVVAIVFASAVAVPTLSRLSTMPEITAESNCLFLAVALFAALCWLNCAAIERWEQDYLSSRSPMDRHAPWVSRHFRTALMALAVAAIACSAGFVLASPVAGPRLDPICVAIFLSAAILWILDRRRSSLSPMQLRIAADAALLTPLTVLPFLGR